MLLMSWQRLHGSKPRMDPSPFSLPLPNIWITGPACCGVEEVSWVLSSPWAPLGSPAASTLLCSVLRAIAGALV